MFSLCIDLKCPKFLNNELCLFCETRPESIHQTMIRTLKQLVGVRPWYTPHSAEKRPAQHRQAGSSQSWPCTKEEADPAQVDSRQHDHLQE